VNYLRRSSAGVLLFRLRVCLFLNVFKWVNIRGSVSFCRHRRSELDKFRLIPEDIGPSRVGTMLDDYVEVFVVVKGRGHALLATLRIGIFTTFSNGSISGFQEIKFTHIYDLISCYDLYSKLALRKFTRLPVSTSFRTGTITLSLIICTDDRR
jgi:hypothetical protein